MKTLGKLNFNSEKLMKNNELVTLRGGYGTCGCLCYDWEGHLEGVVTSDALHCNVDCLTYVLDHGYGYWSC